MNFKNIKTKLLFWYSITILLILSIFSYVLLSFFYEQNVKTVDAKVMSVLHDIDYDIKELYERNFIKGFDEGAEFMIKNLYVTVYKYENDKFTMIASNKPELKTGNFQYINRDGFQLFTIGDDLEDQLRVIRFHTNKLQDEVYIQAVTTLGDKMHDTIHNLKYILMILIPLIILLTIIMGYFIIRSALLPVKNVIDEVKSIDVSDLHKRIQSQKSNDEIEELITTFNTMLGRLDESVSKIKRFSNDVSHELKTPLTVIRGEIELGLRKDRTNEEYKEILKSSLQESKQLQELIDSLLFLSNANENELKAKFEKIELDEILMDIISEYKQLTKDKNIAIEFESLENMVSQGHPLLVKIMVGNIIQNSIKYSNPDSKIIISLKNKELSIQDFGIGIKEKDIKYIFDRFYRVDEARGRGGYGLGLSIVQNIANIHNYTLDIKSSYGEYTKFTIRF
ncbi:MAG: ATP-binding protein [Arcobacteraceae bacterium]